MPTYKYLRTGDVIGDCVKLGKAWIEREQNQTRLDSAEREHIQPKVKYTKTKKI